MFWVVAGEYYPVYRPGESVGLLWTAFFIAVAASILSLIVAPIVRAGVWGAAHRRLLAWTALAVSVTGFLGATVVMNLAQP